MIPSPHTILIEFRCHDCDFKSESLTEASLHLVESMAQRNYRADLGVVEDMLPKIHDLYPVSSTPPGFKLLESRRKIRNYTEEEDAQHTD